MVNVVDLILGSDVVHGRVHWTSRTRSYARVPLHRNCRVNVLTIACDAVVYTEVRDQRYAALAVSSRAVQCARGGRTRVPRVPSDGKENDDCYTSVG